MKKTESVPLWALIKKLSRIMKITAFLLLIFCLHVSASSLAQTKVSLEMKSTFGEVVEQLEKMTEYRFVIKSNEPILDEEVEVKFNNQGMDKVLDKLLEDSEYQYKIIDRYIAISPKNENNIDQQKSVSGSVNDNSGEPLPGVTVIIKGTTQGTVTNIDGNYTITNVSPETVLVFSFVGMLTQEVNVANQTAINVTLKADAIGIEEVVAIGYGTTTKRKAVGAISTIKAEKLEQTTYANVGEALQGQVPGLIVHNSGGKPGDIPSISLRGGSTPLFVIDGVIKDEYAFSVINPEDIESISFLKDASATAVYGSRAGDGIILVQTKRGKNDQVTMRYSGSYQLSQPTVLPNLLNSYQFASVQNDADAFDGVTPFYSAETLDIIQNHKDLNAYPDNDWQDLNFKNFAGQQRHNLSLTGGDEKTNYFVSLGYLDQDGLLKSDAVGLERYNIRSNVTSSYKKIGLDVSLNLSADLQKTKEPSTGTTMIFRSTSYLASPMLQCYNADGTYAAGYGNSVLYADKESGYINERKKNIDAQLDLKWKVPGVDGLTAGMMGSYRDGDFYYKQWDVLAPQFYPDGSIYPTSKPVLTVNSGYAHVFDFETRLAYNNTFGKHGIDAVMVYTQREGYSEDMMAYRKEYTSSAVDQLFAGPFEGQNNGGSASENGSAGVVGRVKYDFASRYILELSGRYDGNDNFSEDQRWGFFPAVSGAWVIGDESFMEGLKSNDILTNLKLRAGWGQTGITAGVNRFGYMPVYNLKENVMNIGNSLINGFSEGPLVNPNELTWYTRESTNIGFDFALLNNSFEGNFDYFYYETSGFLMSPENRYSATLGKSLPQVSSNSVHRRNGVEFVLRYKKRLKDWYFEVGGNMSYYNQLWETKEDEDMASLKNPYVRETQQKDFFRKLYVSDGLYQTADEVLNTVRPIGVEGVQRGDIRYVDENGDGKVDSQDIRRIGKPDSPHLNYGIDFKVMYKAWSVSGLIQGTGDRYVELGLDGAIPRDILRTNQLDYWNVDNTDARFPRISNGYDHGNGMGSDYWIENAQYIRLKNLQVRYDLKHKLLKNFEGISGCNLILTGTNLITFSDVMDYFDPESWMAVDEEWTGNVSGASYPVQRTFSLGVNVEF